MLASLSVSWTNNTSMFKGRSGWLAKALFHHHVQAVIHITAGFTTCELGGAFCCCSKQRNSKAWKTFVIKVWGFFLIFKFAFAIIQTLHDTLRHKDEAPWMCYCAWGLFYFQIKATEPKLYYQHLWEGQWWQILAIKQAQCRFHVLTCHLNKGKCHVPTTLSHHCTWRHCLVVTLSSEWVIAVTALFPRKLGTGT